MKPTLFPNWERPTIELATDPPATVSSIVSLESNFLNSFSFTSFMVLFVKEFSIIKLSSTLQITSIIAFPIPKIFIFRLCFFGFNWLFSIWITSFTDFTSNSITVSSFTIFSTIPNYL